MESAEKVESLLNGSRIKFELDQIFARLPHDFSFVLKESWVVSREDGLSCRNRLITSSNFCSNFVRRPYIMLKADLHGTIFAYDCRMRFL